MTVRSITALSLASLISGCAALGYGTSKGDVASSNADANLTEEAILASEKVIVPAGDDELQRAVEAKTAGLESNGEHQTQLDEAIQPELKEEAKKARETLDSKSDSITKEAAIAEQQDLLQRLRGLFALDHSVTDKRVQQQLNWYVSHPSYIDRVLNRGGRYLHHIINEVEARGLPGELALLPIVESAFDPFAYSHGRAAGMWQFIPSTGKYFGLKQSWWHDQRRDVVASTDAALRYLERLAARFDGDFTLALASYNSGGGTVSKAIRKNTRLNRSTDFWSLDLPRETEAYVPKLIALAKIFDDPKAYGLELPTLEDKPYFAIVETSSQIDLAQAAELAGVDIDEIYLLNPSYNRWATSPDGPHRLLVPVANAAQFKTGLAAIDPQKRVAWQNYKVVSGDSLIRIANKFGTTPAVIQQVNNMRGSLIRIGQRLLIPTAREGTANYVLSQSQRLAKKQSKGKGTRIEHKVQSGDTFWDIARDNGVSVRQLASWNGMAPGDPLFPGKKLVIWSTDPGVTTVTNNGRDKGMVRKVGYRVRKGDSLAAIANRFSVNVSDIAGWNDLNTARYLQPGQSLVLYVDIRNSP
ncbi:LysM peptidoglycan-binding domain-containing protein [Marinobacter caseinilyticus]|uniref:LysM peptidoglycan-binding domain-containing protein n=1 Tax=Marinobacter caseinilyticus TaxID=2692195 RepID=UPI00140C727D|nr:LysM peptidoglycan-binding domain-containing protein [Marinobacter caseinilyticus]